MNATVLNTELTKLLRRAIEEGVQPGKLSVDEAVGCLARHQHTLLNIDAGIRQKQAQVIQHVLAHRQAASIVAAPPGLDVKGGVK